MHQIYDERQRRQRSQQPKRDLDQFDAAQRQQPGRAAAAIAERTAASLAGHRVIASATAPARVIASATEAARVTATATRRRTEHCYAACGAARGATRECRVGLRRGQGAEEAQEAPRRRRRGRDRGGRGAGGRARPLDHCSGTPAAGVVPGSSTADVHAVTCAQPEPPVLACATRPLWQSALTHVTRVLGGGVLTSLPAELQDDRYFFK